jgi:cytochrome c oxidase cbb3-type subunit III
MSDFTSDFWSIYVSAVTLIGIVACLLLLWASSKAKVAKNADNTTGHVWDGDLREMNNPLPRWWAGLFVITIVFSLAYLVLYPGLGTFKGTLGWTSVAEHQQEVDEGNAQIAPLYADFAAINPVDLARNARAMAVGERLFMNNCAQCHASDGAGSKGIPNLSDRDWLYGGEPAQIIETITKGRTGIMPPMGAAIGGSEEVKNLAQYVLSLSGSPHDSLRAALGKPKFAACAACHGANGKGNTALGAPNLTDDVSLHGYGEAAIIAMINGGKVNQMPPQADKLTEGQIKVLASYVWGLSNPPVVAAK